MTTGFTIRIRPFSLIRTRSPVARPTTEDILIFIELKCFLPFRFAIFNERTEGFLLIYALVL